MLSGEIALKNTIIITIVHVLRDFIKRMRETLLASNLYTMITVNCCDCLFR